MEADDEEIMAIELRATQRAKTARAEPGADPANPGAIQARARREMRRKSRMRAFTISVANRRKAA
ncbi:hypothetical protein [Paraburkholderia sp. SOS3]|uniref:hypothetical protein n=1 Tax=Paraburkholderia sp. SOS3 TaxID=1926494 RepID=UPI0012EC6D93|nr:hypothetical protein [Paraburkholderia sp. SOS3]